MSRILNKILVIVFIISALGICFPKRSFALEPQGSFIVQLAHPEALNELKKIGTNIRQVFSFSSSSEFQNTYAFNSRASYFEIQRLLSGSSLKLQKNNNFASEGITVNDPGFTENSEDIDRQWGLVKAGVSEAWNATTGSSKNVIAVIDTGIDATHEDLKNVSLVPGFDFINTQGLSGNINSDDNGHGTLVAGILAASANNSKGIVGINWSVTLMPIKALNQDGRGDSAGIAEAIVWAVDNGARIINISLGGLGFEHDPTLAEAVSYAFHKNAIIVAAAGNDVAKTGGNMDESPVFPICDDNDINMVIGVAATDQNDRKADFSNFGKNCIDVAAPGKRILSTINHDPITRQESPNAYAFASGTSLAVPFVSGQAALILSKYPTLTNIQVRDRIMATAENIDYSNPIQCAGSSCKGMLGAGRINVQKSLEVSQNSLILRDGDVVKTEIGAVYQIVGGQRRPVSPLVFNQRFSNVPVRLISSQQILAYPESSFATPIEGTLVKTANSPTVYYINKGMKMPVLYSVFVEKGFVFSDVLTADVSEVDSWLLGKFLTPKEGTLVKTPNKKTLYWVVGESLHAVNDRYFKEQGLSYFPIMTVSDNDLQGFSRGEAYTK